METIAVKAAAWVVGKALDPVTGGLLEAWAASNGLGPNVDALKMELLYAQGLLDNAEGREIRSPALKELLHRLRQLAYNADDVLDEIEYFRIQDELDGTYHAADKHAGGCIKVLAHNARHTVSAVVAKLKPSSCSSDITTRGEHNEQDNSAKQGCISSVCWCGGRTVISSPPPSPTNQDDHKVNGDENGQQFFCGALPSRVQGCLSGTRLHGKREMSSSPPSPTTSQCDKKVVCGCLPKVITSTACNTAKSIGKRLLCCSFQSVDENAHTGMLGNPKLPYPQTPKLKFNRVEISAKMKDITEHLKPVCAKVSNILNLEFMGTNRITRKDIAKKRPTTTSDITENQLYGRNIQKKRIVDGITHGEYFSNTSNELAVLPIVGPGGIGKTTFTQHVYKEVKCQFDVDIWICVSLDFNASRLEQEAVKQIPKVDDEEENTSGQKKIERRLKDKRFLLVLDDMWTCDEYEWKKLLALFGRVGEKGSMVIVTTRIPEVAKLIKTVECCIELERLEAEDFMHLFESCIFGGQKPWDGHAELFDVGREIASKLKRFPLEAKTVGRLLRDQLTLEHWSKVLESKEWELQTNEDDIMPALKLSYDHLPFHLQQCFYYCALFPEDYEFQRKELVHFWIGLDIVHPCDLNKRIEDVGLGYLDDLVNYGFFKKNEKNGGCPYYVIHDLLHNLAVKVSSFECLSIHSSNVKSIQIPQDVRHLSIIVDNKDVEDIKAFKYYKSDLSALEKRMKFENLRTLMVFGEHHGSFAKTFCDLFEKARALRAIYLSGASDFMSVASYTVSELLCRFSNLIHLRYLRIKSAYMKNTDFLSALSRLYHLEVIDLQECRGHYGFTRHMSNLAKLRHFLLPEFELQLHSNIAEVGKLTLLQELRRFEVGIESKGFELSQLGQMSELGGSLAIYNLERIRAMEEANEARLVHIKHLRSLTLMWDGSRPEIDTEQEQNALEILMPHSNIQDLRIVGHGGTKCPQWLGENLSVKNLESLYLREVAWKTFPPIGELWLVNEPHEKISGNIPDAKFQNLRRLELSGLDGLKKWVGDNPCQLFAHLKVLIIEYCWELTELSFSHSTCCQQEKQVHMNWFPRLQELKINYCPKLLSFPPVPWTSTQCSASITGIGLGFEELVCNENYHSEYSLKIMGKDDLDSTFWNLVAFDNLTELKELVISRCPPLPLHSFQILSSLKTLKLWNSSSIVLPLAEGESHAEYHFPTQHITITDWDSSMKELTRLLTYFPNLSELDVGWCKQTTELGVVEKQATATPKPSSSATKAKDAEIEQHQQRDVARGKEEIAAEGLLLLPPQLQKLEIRYCPELRLHCDPVDYNRQGLQGLRSLRSLHIEGCPRFLSSYSSSSSPPCFPFPTSLEHLFLSTAMGMETLLPLSNLTSLTYLFIGYFKDLRGEGLWPLLAQGHLSRLIVRQTPNFFAGPEPLLPHEPEFPSSSSKLQWLETDDITGFVVAPICTFLSSSLTELDFWSNEEVQHFTKGQEGALQLLTSLEKINFQFCDKLRCPPAGLHRLPSLKILDISYCKAIGSLPEDGLPSSLQELVIDCCPAMRSIPKECLPNSLQKLVIRNCPAIRSLPKADDLPSSLRELGVHESKSEELRRQCRKLIGTIPIVRA